MELLLDKEELLLDDNSFSSNSEESELSILFEILLSLGKESDISDSFSLLFKVFK